MAKSYYKPHPWPFEASECYQLAYNELLRVRAMLETCLAEYEVDNPYIFDNLLPLIKSRIYKINKCFQEIQLYAPEGQGPPPKWLKITNKGITFLSDVYEKLDSHELKKKLEQNRYPQISDMTKDILTGVRYLIDQMVSIPLEQASIKITQSGFKEVVLQ